ncbi:4-hydroxy-3-methylbut-2-enyl diphosphate reductase [Candidatus Desantisbacteria bacterium CG_4_10_14_3_um_filter_40_18]|uniref:4-hydroxy-3-methylbut-2-enyl diphosphate reductase n=1 Tax=Candidatus Desantisbacteria bacterium CG_4_10_14_3_um_filter_40_18 TaxID=1974544 RepID=A0A2M7P2P0_9BACT|nr:MAG: 4-hydroxy-3-methylbut-2-enyl diphosphate reductase [Candidatus Desantisbacteria bacterium CG_4_10_14_3_um_filter_40_18]
MEIILSKEAGFCFGVKRALKLTLKTLANEKGHVYTMGPLIHNPQAVEDLKNKGVLVAESLDEIKSGVVVLRSHGVPPKLYQQILDTGLKIVDAVCPNVKLVQKLVAQLKQNGYTVVVVGEKNHPEVMSVPGIVEGETLVIENIEQAAGLPWVKRLGVVAQTTQTCEHFRKIISVLLHRTFELRTYHTICEAVEKRQQNSLDIAKQVNMMLVIGGKNSANTSRLAQVCAMSGCTTHHIETAAEIQSEWLKGIEKIGITAGASTPPWIIDEVMDKLTAISL